MCQPKAAGNCSSEQYSDTVNVKLLNAMPRKKPQINSQIMSLLYSVCSAITSSREWNENKQKQNELLMK